MTDPAGHIFPKWGPRGPFRVYTWTQSAVTGIGVVLSAVVMVAGFGPQAVALVALLGMLLVRDSTGTPAWTRVGTGLAFLVSGWTGRRRGETSPFGLIEVVEHQVPAGVMGVCRDRGRYLAAIRIGATANPWIASTADREIAGDDWARLVASLPLEVVDRLQIVVTSSTGDPDLLAGLGAADGPGLEIVKEIAGDLAATARRLETLLIVRLTRSASRDADHRGGVEAAGHLLYSTIQHLGSQLPNETLVAEILAPSEWRQLLDPVIGQEGWEEGWASARIGSIWHRGEWVWDWPQRPIQPGFLAPLLAGDGDRTVSLTIEPLDPEPRQRALDFAFRRAEAAVATAAGGKHRKQADLESLDLQLTELNHGHIPVRALLTVVSTATTRGELEDLAGTIRSNAVAGSCRATLAGGSQLRMLASVLPLCRALDPAGRTG